MAAQRAMREKQNFISKQHRTSLAERKKEKLSVYVWYEGRFYLPCGNYKNSLML
jgi:hypothetical protein